MSPEPPGPRAQAPSWVTWSKGLPGIRHRSELLLTQRPHQVVLDGVKFEKVAVTSSVPRNCVRAITIPDLHQRYP